MTRAITILVLSAFIWIQTPAAQLFKIYTLVEHYFEHKHENTSLSFVGFLRMHYADDSAGHPGHNRDMQLPFKQCNIAVFAIGFFEENGCMLPQKDIHQDVIKQLLQYTAPYYAVEALSKIWQPPRAC